jgi:hypothetical protein
MGYGACFAVAMATLTITPTQGWSWGMDGHHSIGMVADMILKDDPAGATARQILGASLSEAAVWADCAKGICNRPLTGDEQTYVHDNPQHTTYHYTDVPIQQSFYKLGAAGTRANDVVQLITQSVGILRGKTTTGSAKLDRKSALWVLAHMVGDIHQPLHVGAIYFDRDCNKPVDPNVIGAGQTDFGIGSSSVSSDGGNDLKLGGNKSFHVTYWDDATVTGAMRLAGVRNQSNSDFASYIVAHAPAGWETSGDPGTWSEQWANEIMPLANDALTKITIGGARHATPGRNPKCTWPVTLPQDYADWANGNALTQLSRAGFRLAAILRAALQATP